MKRQAIYPGTFDPLTYGHLDIIKRASKIFDKVIVAVARNPYKKPLFSLQERLIMVKKATEKISNVTVEEFDSLIVDYARQKKINVIIRGLRMISDFEYEFQMALTNRRLSKAVETLFMMPSEEYAYLSSKLLKEAASLKGDIKKFVPLFVAKKLQSRFKNRKES